MIEATEILQLPKTIIGWVGIISTLILVISFIFYQLRRNDIALLRASVNDLTIRVEFLEKENARITTAYKDVKFKKDYLKSIVMQALSQKGSIDKSLVNMVKTHLEDGK